MSRKVYYKIKRCCLICNHFEAHRDGQCIKPVNDLHNAISVQVPERNFCDEFIINGHLIVS